jgi:glycosidase
LGISLESARRPITWRGWGIGAVWLSPIYPTPDADLGYDISDYLAVDPRFGTLEEFDRLLAALHERDIHLILDLVPNHTSDQHPWFIESRTGPESPKHDWYVWRDSRPDGSPPNNWESYFGGSAWSYVEPPGKWYLHSFDRGQPDLNWENPQVRRALLDAMRFWLDRGVDGFRVDGLWLLGDHDFPRIASRIGPERARLAHMLLLTLRGTPTWYYGDELGLPNPNPPATLTMIDPQASTAPERDRLIARTPMQWTSGPHAGFSKVEPWLPIVTDDPDFTVERQRDDPESVLSFVRTLIDLRKRTPALSVGTYRSLPAPPEVFSFQRPHPDGTVQVYLNFGDVPREVRLPRGSRVLLSTAGTKIAERPSSTRMTLAAYEGIMVA